MKTRTEKVFLVLWQHSAFGDETIWARNDCEMRMDVFLDKESAEEAFPDGTSAIIPAILTFKVPKPKAAPAASNI